MAEGTVSRIIDLGDAWTARKSIIAKRGDARSLNDFTATMNALTGQLMSEFGRSDQQHIDFYESVAELCNNASARIRNAKIFADGRDVTNL